MRYLMAFVGIVEIATATFGSPLRQAPRPPQHPEPPAAPANDGYDPAKVVPPGYQWQKVGNEPWKLVAVPGVAAAPTFRNAGFHSGHSCPQCGRGVFVQAGAGPVPGTHWHECPVDHTRWFH